MKIIRNQKNNSIRIRFENSFGLREAIGLPTLIARLPRATEITLDFTAVRWMKESAFTALIPALVSLRSAPVHIIGLEAFEPELRTLSAA